MDELATQLSLAADSHLRYAQRPSAAALAQDGCG